MKSTPSSQVPQAIRSRANHNLGRLGERPSEQSGPGPRPARGQQRLLRREGPQGVTEERDKAGVDRRSCSRSRGNIPSPSPTKTSCYAPRRAAGLRKPSGPVCAHRGWWGGGGDGEGEDEYPPELRRSNRKAGRASKRRRNIHARRPDPQQHPQNSLWTTEVCCVETQVTQNFLIPNKHHLHSLWAAAPSRRGRP